MSDLPRTRTPIPADYRIEFSAQSWAELGTVPAHVFKQIRGKLEDLALGVAKEGSSGGQSGAPRDGVHRFEVDGFVSTCELDLGRRAIVLVSVTQRGAN